MDNVACLKCGASLKPYWLKDGVCNGCRNPHLIIEDTEHECDYTSEVDNDICPQCGEHAGFCKECGETDCCG